MKPIFKTGKRIRLGVWGLGRGATLITTANMLNIDVVAGCDINPIMRENFRAVCPEAFITDNATEFLSRKDVDAVLIATFFPAHAEHAIAALNAGKHVMCEVTAFFTPAEGVRLAEAVEKSGKVYHLLENYPFQKENMFLRKLWQDGLFGEFQYGEFEYCHDCRSLSYCYNIEGYPPVKPGYTVHSWRSWLPFHYYNTHSLGPLMWITGLRPTEVTAVDNHVTLPGSLANSRFATACPSLIRMSNGGIMRNLIAATTMDNHTGKRLWGTRAAAESTGNGLKIAIGGIGSATKIPVSPQWPELAELADSTGHGGGDFWELYYFAREIFTGEPGPWTIYPACDVTLAGIMATKSAHEGGKTIEIPDFRDSAVRNHYRNDNFQAKFLNPQQIFPPELQNKDTDQFTAIMAPFLHREGILATVRGARDGMVIYNQIADDSGKLAVVKNVTKLLLDLPDYAQKCKKAIAFAQQFHDTIPGQALSSVLHAAEAEKLTEETTLRQELTSWLERL